MTLFRTFLFIILASTQIGLFAQEAIENKKWKFLVEPYIMFANMNGTVGIGNLPDAQIDANTNDIFSNLKMGFMLNAEASNNKWAVGSDKLYMNLGKKRTLSRDIFNSSEILVSGELTAKQIGWELMSLHRITPWLEIGIGGLINSVQTDVELTLPEIGEGTRIERKSKSETWLDPMIIMRVKSKEGEQFVYQFRGEIGGFGIGSGFACQIQAYAGYKYSKLFEITGGYRKIGLEYVSGTGEDRYLFDVDISGPVIRFGFRF